MPDMKLLHFILGVLVLGAVLFVAQPASACPACQEAVINASGKDDDDPMREARAYNRSIYLMVAVPYGTFVYRVTRHYIVANNNLAVLRDHGTEILRLQACHPRFFATHRYIVDAVPVVTPANS